LIKVKVREAKDVQLVLMGSRETQKRGEMR